MALTQLTRKKVISSLSVSEARAALEAAVGRERKEVEKRNKAFQKLSDKRKRIVVAQDVLVQLDLRRLVPTFGTYLEVPAEVDERFSQDFEDGQTAEPQIHEALSGVSCKVCGIGGLFVAAVDRANQCTVGEMSETNDSEFMREYLSDFFSIEQLALVEAAFEGRLISSYDTGLTDYSDEVRRAVAFTKRVQSPAGRLRKIMNNIIEHEGTFTP